MQLLNKYEKKLENDGKSALTIKNELSSVRAFFKWYRFWNKLEEDTPLEELVSEVSVRTIRDWRESFMGKIDGRGFVKKTKTATTLNKDLQRIRRFFTYMLEQNLVVDNPAEPHEALQEAGFEPKWLTPEEQDKLKRAVKKMYLGSHLAKKNWRNYMVIIFLLNTGLRSDELCGLTESNNLKTHKNGKEVKMYLDFYGKGNKQRVVGLHKELQREFQMYLDNHERKGDFLFDTERSEQMTTRTVQHIVAEVAKESGIDFTAHMLRHSFIKNLVNAGVPLEKVARIAGHVKKNGTVNLDMTLRYAMSTSLEAADSVDVLSAI